MFRSLVFTFIFSHCLSYVLASEQPFSKNVFVVTRNSTRAAIIAKSLPNKSRLISRYDNFLIIEIEKFDANLLNYLRKLGGVSRVQRTFRGRYLSSVDDQCNPSVKPIITSDLTKDMKCLALSKCGQGKKSRLWAQKFLGTDLAQSYLDSKKVPRTSSIAIIDSGFDLAYLDQIENSHNLKVYSANPDKAIESDVNGHGSRVVSMIKGHQGIGGSVGSPVSLYGLGKSNNIDMTEVGLGVLQACESGADIVNISIGADLGIIQTKLSNLLPKEIMDRIQNNGCILIHASGNEGAPLSTNDVSSLEFDIGSTNSDGKTSSFSSNSQFTSPGEDVVGLQISKNSNSDKTLECFTGSEAKQSFSSGTSFASPLFTATVALVRDMLLQSSTFKKLRKSEQAMRLREILNLSTIDGIPNAFLAVQIAEEWIRKPSESINSAAHRFQELNTKKCQSMSPQICNEGTCAELDRCESRARSHALTCGAQDPMAISSLIEFLQKRGDLENSSYWIRRYAQLFPKKPLNIKFPSQQMTSELIGNPTQSMTLRWVKYFNLWKTISNDDKNVLQASLLKQESIRALNRISDLNGREKSASAYREISSLFVEMKKLDSTQSSSATDWAENMWKDPSKMEFAVATILRAQREGVVSPQEVQSIADKLLEKKDLAQKNVTYALILLQELKLSDSQKLSYSTKLLADPTLSEENIDKAVNIALVKDPMAYLTAIETASRHPNAGPKSWLDIAMRINFLTDELTPDQKIKSVSILNELNQRPDIGEWAKAAIEMALNRKK